MRASTRLRFWLQRRRRNADLAEEMRLHREMLEEQIVGEGMSPADARFAAERRFGNPTAIAEQSREQWSPVWVDGLVRDVSFAWRLLVRQPMFAAAAILTVAFGVGANTAVVSVLETVLLNPLGLRHADPVMAARTQYAKLQLFHSETSGVEFREIQEMTDAFSAAAAMEGRAWTLMSDGQPSRLVGQAVTPDFFRVFGEFPASGRFFTREDDHFYAVLSDALWRSQYAADPSAVGRTMMLDNKPYRIVGVARAEFRFPAQAQLWVPLILEPGRLLDSERGSNMTLSVFARRKEGVSEAQATDRVSRHVASLKSEDAAHGGEIAKYGYDIELTTFGRYIAGDLHRPLLLLWAAALVVLLIGCANIAGLLLARSSTRRHEIAIRISVGATPSQIIRQLLLESLLIGAFGGAAGLAMAALAISFLSQLTIPNARILALVALDSRLLLYGFALALGSGLLFALAPAIQLLRQSQSTQLGRSRRRWFQDLFVTAEVCGAFVLIVMTTLLLRSLWAVERIEPGFDPKSVTTAFFIKPSNDPGFFDRLQTALRSAPGVQSAAVANPVPFADSGVITGFAIKNRQEQSGLLWHGEGFQVTSDYFQTLRIPLLRGRNLSASDTANTPKVCLIDSKFAERFFAGQDPIGQELMLYGGWARIVGVVAAIRGTTLEDGSRPTAYYSFAQVPYFSTAAALVRSKGSAESIIRAAVRQANPAVPVYDVKSLEERLGETLGIRRAMVMLLSTFGAISLVLAVLGVYGVIAQVVSERTREIGIRMALGARPTQILSQFLRQGLQSGVFGLLIGFASVAYAQRWLAGMLYHVDAFDPLTFISASAGVLALLLAAVWWPARRAARIDPQQALRHE